MLVYKQYKLHLCFNSRPGQYSIKCSRCIIPSRDAWFKPFQQTKNAKMVKYWLKTNTPYLEAYTLQPR